MYGGARRGRGGVGAAPSGLELSPTIGPDVSSYSIADRVSDLNLTVSTLTPHTESRIRSLLDEILVRGQYAENAFELVAYACALEKEKDARLLGLILDLIFEKVKGRNEVAPMLGRLFLIFRHALLPNLQDGMTVGLDGLPLKGYSLFMKYFLDRCRKEMDLAWDEKERAKQDGGGVDAAVRLWFALVDLVNDLRKRFLIDDSIVHEAIEKQMSITKLTSIEASILIVLLSPVKPDVKSFKARGRVEAHYSQLRKMVEDENIDYILREKLKESVLGKLPSTVTTATSIPTLSISEPIHEHARSLGPATDTAIQASVPARLQLKSPDFVYPSSTPSPVLAGNPVPTLDLDSRMLGGEKFHVDSKTPLAVVIAFFTKVARPPVADVTSELQSATFSENPISSSTMSDVWRATLKGGTHVAVKCVKSTMSGDDKAVKHTVRELAAWSQQQHVNILQLLGLALYKDKLTMVSEWMEQGSIIKVVNKHPEVDRYSLCVQVVGVVVWLHNKGLIHGDLKGANILISDSGIPKITDFGLTVMSDGPLQFSETFAGGGTIRWMAPELFEENARKSFKTDVYALGMTTLEILTGQDPFPEISSPHGIIKAVSVDKLIPRRPDCLAAKTVQNEVFWDAMVKCWAYDPTLRATAEEIEKLIGSVEDGKGLMKSVSTKRGSMCSNCTLA